MILNGGSKKLLAMSCVQDIRGIQGMLRKAFLFGFIFGFTMIASIGPQGTVQASYAQDQYSGGYSQPVANPLAQLWYSMGPNDRMIVDRIAADFYERSMRYAQTQSIQSSTAQAYVQSHPQTRHEWRQERRQQWQALNENQRQAMRAAKRPSFMHLTDAQKWPFRTHALQQLASAGAVNTAQSGRYNRPGI